MERNFRLTLAYDGTRYRGWQRQGNTPDTIQSKLENLLGRLLGQDVEVHGSGRTDAGVHAAGQVASFRADTDMDCSALLKAVREYLPEDIGALSLEEAPARFHARLSAKEKTYVYRVWNSDVPCVFERRYVYIYPAPLDTDAMRRAAADLPGRHDFSAFSSGFLYNRARILTGTLLEIGAGERPADDIGRIFQSRSRAEAGFTAPAKGLCLMSVRY